MQGWCITWRVCLLASFHYCVHCEAMDAGLVYHVAAFTAVYTVRPWMQGWCITWRVRLLASFHCCVHCEAMDAGLVYHVACLFTPQLSLLCTL